MSNNNKKDFKDTGITSLSGKQYVRVSHSIDALYRQVFKGSPFLDEVLSAISAIPLRIASNTMSHQFIEAERALRYISIEQELGYIGDHKCYKMTNRDVWIYSEKYCLYFSLGAVYFHYLQTMSYMTRDIIATMAFATQIRVSQVDIGAEQLKSYILTLSMLGELLEVPKYSKNEIRRLVQDHVVAVYGQGYESGYYSAGDQLHDVHVYPLVYTNRIPVNKKKLSLSKIESFSRASLRSCKPWMSSFKSELKTEAQWFSEEYPVYVEPEQVVEIEEVPVVDLSNLYDIEIMECNSDDEEGECPDFTHPEDDDDAYPGIEDTDIDNVFDCEDEIIDTTCGLVEEELERQIAELMEVEDVKMVDPTNFSVDAIVREGFIAPEYYKSDPSYNSIILSKVNDDRHIVFLDALQIQEKENMLSEYARKLTYKGQAKWVVYACSRYGSLIRRVRVSLLGLFDSLEYSMSKNILTAFKVNGCTLQFYKCKHRDFFHRVLNQYNLGWMKIKDQRGQLIMSITPGMFQTHNYSNVIGSEFENYMERPDLSVLTWNGGLKWFLYSIWLKYGNVVLLFDQFQIELI